MKPCTCQNVAVNIQDHVTVAIVCAIHGRTYLLRKPDGGWETQDERRERMKSDRVCETCKAEYQIHQHKVTGHAQAGKLCPSCLAALPKLHNIGWRRNNPNTP
jgi:hypothetical protein